MNDLEYYFRNNNKRLIHKWIHYFEIYDNHFNRFRNKPITLLEIGCYQGGSLQMWKHYFGNQAKIYGIDINPKCKQLEEENIQVFIGSQTDTNFLQTVISKIAPIDILIDDGGHTMKQQIVSFGELYPHIQENGVYLCEDLHTSYWKDYGGGYKKKSSFIEYSKNFIDSLHAYHSREKKFKVDPITQSAHSLHYYDSIMVIEKRKRLSLPIVEMTGNWSFPEEKSL